MHISNDASTSKGMNVRQQRSEMSAVHVALISGHRAVVAVLLSCGADVTSRLIAAGRIILFFPQNVIR